MPPSGLQQSSQVQGIFNLAVVACFVGIAFPWLQKGALFARSTTTFPGREKKGPFLDENPDFELKKPANAGETKNHKQR